jgi:hypothetical protein
MSCLQALTERSCCLQIGDSPLRQDMYMYLHAGRAADGTEMQLLHHHTPGRWPVAIVAGELSFHVEWPVAIPSMTA